MNIKNLKLLTSEEMAKIEGGKWTLVEGELVWVEDNGKKLGYPVVPSTIGTT